MPLRVNLRPYEQVMINGAVITNLKRRAQLVIHNQAQILQGKYVLKEKQANSPIRRLYFAVQMSYVNADEPDVWLEWSRAFVSYVTDALSAMTNKEMRERLEQTIVLYDQKQYYKALRLLHDVIEYEEKLFEMNGISLPPAFGDGLNPPETQSDDEKDDNRE